MYRTQRRINVKVSSCFLLTNNQELPHDRQHGNKAIENKNHNQPCPPQARRRRAELHTCIIQCHQQNIKSIKVQNVFCINSTETDGVPMLTQPVYGEWEELKSVML